MRGTERETLEHWYVAPPHPLLRESPEGKLGYLPVCLCVCLR